MPDTMLKDTEYNFQIEKIGLCLPCMNLVPSLAPLLAMRTNDAPARYRVYSIDMHQYPLPKDTLTYKYHYVYEGKLQQKNPLVAFYEQDTFSGENPMTHMNMDLWSISIVVNGLVLRKLEINFGEGPMLEACRQFIE